jgi:hypothetical protein
MIGTLIQILSSGSFSWGVKLMAVFLVIYSIVIGVMFFIIDNQRIKIRKLKRLITEHGIEQFDVSDKRTNTKKR